MGEEIGTDTNAEKADDTKMNKFCRKHGINPNLIMLKITLFVMYGATSSLLPYLTIHMQSIGLTVEEIAIIYLALPFTTFLSPPITGFLVDKFGRYKPVVIMTLILNAIFHHALMVIPQQEIPGQMPSAFVMRHPETGKVEVWWSPCPSRECPEEEEINVVVDQCLDHCLLLEQNPKIEIAPPPTNAPIRLPNNQQEVDDLNFQLKKKNILLNAKNKSGDGGGLDGYSSSTTESTAFVDDMRTIQFSNDMSTTGMMEAEESEEESWVAGSGDWAAITLDMHPDLGEPPEQLGIEVEQDESDNVTDFKQRFGEKLLWASGVNVTELEEGDLRCGGLVLASNMTIYTQRLSDWTADCMIQKCEFRMGGPDICPPDYKESDDKIFWIYFGLRFLATTMLSAGVTIMDPIALTMIEKYGGDFGRERLFSSIGMAIFSPITGFMIDYSSRGLGYTDYSAAFYTYDILLLVSAITVFLMPLGEKLPADNVFRDMINLLRLPHVIIFILFLFALGNFWGFIESFLFLYLKELGAPNYLLGITITVGTVSSIPFLYGAEKITKIFGHVNLIVIAFVSHACRLVGYSVIETAWWCFPFEAMEALSCHLMWVAAATYCSILAPKNLLATLIGVLGMAHFSLGRGSGSFVGGFLIGEVGTREAFRIMGLVAVAAGILYKIIHYLFLRKYDAQVQSQDDEEVIENGEAEKLTEPATKEQGTSMSLERLSLMIKYNQIGSLTSIPRGSKTDIDSLSRRRSSYNIEYVKAQAKGGSASKVDLLKSALEINHKTTNPAMKREDQKRAESAPKLNHHTLKNISHLTLSAVVDEDIEPSALTRNKKKFHQSGILHVPNADLEKVQLQAYFRDAERRDSIPEEEAKENNLEKQRQMLLKNLNAATANTTAPVKASDAETKVPKIVESSSKTATDGTS